MPINSDFAFNNRPVFVRHSYWGWWFARDHVALPLPGDLAAEADVYAAIRAFTVSVGDSELCVSDHSSQTSPTYVRLPIPASDGELFDFLRDGGYLNGDYLVTSPSGKWGCICYSDYYSIVGGDADFVSYLLDALGGEKALRVRVVDGLRQLGLAADQVESIESVWLRSATEIASISTR